MQITRRAQVALLHCCSLAPDWRELFGPGPPAYAAAGHEYLRVAVLGVPPNARIRDVAVETRSAFRRDNLRNDSALHSVSPP